MCVTIRFAGSVALALALAGPSSSFGQTPEPGDEVWAFPTGGVVQTSPAVATDGTVYFGSADDHVYAVNGETGALRWSFDAQGKVYSSPAIGPDGTVYFGSNDEKVFAVDPATGQQRWVFQSGENIRSSPAIGPEGTVYIGSDDFNFYALDGAIGQELWRFRTSGEVRLSPVIGLAGIVYLITPDRLHALDGKTGAVLWQTEELGTGVMSSPAIGCDGVVYVGDHSGNVYAIQGTSGLALGYWTKLHGNRSNAGIGGPPMIGLTDFAFQNGSFRGSVQTCLGCAYALEYRESVTGGQWLQLPLIQGHGFRQTLSDPVASASCRFYRLYVE